MDDLSIYPAVLSELSALWSQVRPHLSQASGRYNCIQTNFAATRKKGYVQIRFRQRKYYVHIVSAMRRYSRAPLATDEVSHLCHNAHCVNAEHLVMEDGDTNKSRLCCKLLRHQGQL